ncbi:TIGR01777 family oxidoreductase [Thalassotalea ganghwensis]
MKLLLTGGTGLIGSALIKQLNNTEVIVLSRGKKASVNNNGNSITFVDTLEDVDFNTVDIVINLAGEPIADKRWTDQQKQRICQSRWQLTEQLVEKIAQATNQPSTFISGSAIGYYGRQTCLHIDENYQDINEEFSHTVCQRWEEIALQAKSENTRVCLLRTGIVLSKNGGALAKMAMPFKLGLGGAIGTGKQYMSWIHIDDMVAAIIHIIDTPALDGPINMTAPNPATNLAFSKAYARALRRPCIFPMPTIIAKLLFGEMADLLLYGQHVVPKKLIDTNFKFRFSHLTEAFSDLV